MRSAKRASCSVTRRDPLPRYGATLDLFSALDRGDFATFLGMLHEEVTGRIELSGGTVIEFGSRDELALRARPHLDRMRNKGATATRLGNYDASLDAPFVIARFEVDRSQQHGRAKLVWHVAPGVDARVIDLELHCDCEREQSGDWTTLPR